MVLIAMYLHSHSTVLQLVKICLFFVLLIPQTNAEVNSRQVRVGLFPAAPLVLDNDGKADGLFIDLLEHIAKQKGWKIKYVHGTWSTLQQDLKNGTIDLLPAIGYTKERAALYDFTKNAVFIDYGVLFTKEKYTIHTIFDLNNTRVAGVKGSLFTTGFKNYIESFGINCEIVGVTDNIQVMEYIVNDSVDAGVCIYSLGNELTKKYSVKVTPVSFSPLALHYAVSKGKNADLIAAFDTMLSREEEDPSSYYTNRFHYWMGNESIRNIPAWAILGSGGLFVAGLLFMLWSIMLKRLVALKTQHLNLEIAERKAVTVKLRESQERLQLATEAARIGIWDWDIISNQMIWDDMMFTIYGIKERPQSFGVELWKSCLHPDDVMFVWDACLAAIRGDINYNVEFRIIHPDQSVRYIKGEGIILRDEDGNAERMLGVNFDITEQKETLEQRQKYEAQIQKNSKIESLGVLAGGIAHDFNNLMGGIYGYIEIAIEKCSDNEKVVNVLRKAVNTIERARALTLQLLTFAKGGAPIMKNNNLFPFVEETALFALSGSNITCRCIIGAGLKPCKFDKNQIGQVVDNLVINAKQAMPDGGVIEIRAKNCTIIEGKHPMLQSGDYVCIAIKDTGTGIAPEIQPKIFEPFVTTKPTGFGLGLASCYSIIKKHGGCIDVESEVGKGSTFSFYLPVSSEQPVDPEQTSNVDHKGNGVFLIVDDEIVILETLQDTLQSLGYTVISMQDGRDVIDYIQTDTGRNADVKGFIFDLTIPGGLGGKDTISEIRKQYPSIPVFVTSGYADDPIIADPVKYGFTASICQPFQKIELKELLNRYCSVR
jgi:signal transduction histidine kinase/ABC-type amino acid transport substrate-binding protein/CheY-like chemotaxis protein